MCLAGIEAEIRDLPAPSAPQAVGTPLPHPAEPRTLRLYPSRPPDSLPKQLSPARAEPQAA